MIKNNVTSNLFQILLYGSFYMHDVCTFVRCVLVINFTQRVALSNVFLGFLFEFLSVDE